MAGKVGEKGMGLEDGGREDDSARASVTLGTDGATRAVAVSATGRWWSRCLKLREGDMGGASPLR